MGYTNILFQKLYNLLELSILPGYYLFDKRIIIRMAIELKDITPPPPSPSYSDVVNSGPKLSPQKIIQTYEDGEWEIFIEECALSLKDIYIDVKRLGGAGDQGVDVGGFKDASGFKGKWDNYQCKHYDHALFPSDALKELGKLCYYTHLGEFSIPEVYYFVAPKGVGTTLSKLLRGKHSELRAMLIAKWSKVCESEITKGKKILLEGDFLDYVNSFDFSIVKDITPLRLIEIHSKTQYHRARFGGGLPVRPVSDTPPTEIASTEQVYINKLLTAYAEYLGIEECTHDDVEKSKKLKSHLQNARIQFYCAESLNKFSRDCLENGEFERLQDNIYSGIENIILSQHNNGFERVVAAVQEAFKLQIDFHPLKDRIEVMDRGGICHQLANNNKLSWSNREQDV